MSRLKSNDELYELVKNNLTKNLPITINRVGGVEYTFAQYCYNNGFSHIAGINAHLKMMAKHPGYFDKNNDINNAKYYIELFVDVMKKASHHTIANITFTNYVEPQTNDYKKTLSTDSPYFKLFNDHVDRCFSYNFFESFYKFDEWFPLLEGKRVLVINPFKNTILQQYQKRDKLFTHYYKNFKYPTFKSLNIITVPITFNEGKCDGFKYNNWVEVIQDVKKQMDSIEYDIVLFSCGVYTYPLMSHVIAKGKSGIYLGGILQLYFGIKGRRYDTPFFTKFMNEHWINPIDDDVAEVKDKIKKSGETEAFGAYF
nr:hypothetical protein [Megavirus caiporensis]